MKRAPMAGIWLAVLPLVGALLIAGQAHAEDPVGVRAGTTLEMSSATSQGGSVDERTLWAVLRSQDGRPLGGERITFYELSTTFGDRLMELGSAVTNAMGEAALVVEPAWPGEHSVVARYGGGGGYEAAQATTAFRSDAPAHAHENAEFGLEQPRKWAPFGFGLLVLAVWGVLGLVLVRVVLVIMAEAPEPSRAQVRAFALQPLRAVSLVPLLPVVALLGLVAIPVGWFVMSGDEPRLEVARPREPLGSTADDDLATFPVKLVRSVSAISTDASGDVMRDSADFPADLAVLDGRVLVLDSNKGRLLTVTEDDRFARTFESNRGGATSLLRAVAMTAHRGLIYVAAPLFGNVVILEPSGHVEEVVQMRVPVDERPFHPAGIAVDEAEQIWLSDSNNHRVVSMSPEGRFVGAIGEDTLGTPGGLAIDDRGNVWVADTGRGDLKKYAPSGELLLTVGAAHLARPESVALDERGAIFVTDTALRAIQVFAPDGAYLGSVSALGAGSAGEGAAALQYPYGIKAASGRLFVVDRLLGFLEFQITGPDVAADGG